MARRELFGPSVRGTTSLQLGQARGTPRESELERAGRRQFGIGVARKRSQASKRRGVAKKFRQAQKAAKRRS